MRKIKAMLIEEIFMLVFVIMFELSFSELKNIGVKTNVLSSILSFSVFIVLSKIIEILVEYIVYRKSEKIGHIRKLIRHIFCFVLTDLAFYLTFCIWTKTELVAGALSIAILILGGGYAVIHLIVSHFIEKILIAEVFCAENQCEELVKECTSVIEINDDYKEDKHDY